MIAVCEYILQIWEVKFTSSFTNLICDYSIKQGLHGTVFEEGQMALNICFTCLNEIVSLDMLIFWSDCLRPKLGLTQEINGLLAQLWKYTIIPSLRIEKWLEQDMNRIIVH